MRGNKVVKDGSGSGVQIGVTITSSQHNHLSAVAMDAAARRMGAPSAFLWGEYMSKGETSHDILPI